MKDAFVKGEMWPFFGFWFRAYYFMGLGENK